jgi:hypothetical protein
MKMLLSSETTAKGTGLEKSAGKEDPVESINSLRGQQCRIALVELSLCHLTLVSMGGTECLDYSHHHFMCEPATQPGTREANRLISW